MSVATQRYGLKHTFEQRRSLSLAARAPIPALEQPIHVIVIRNFKEWLKLKRLKTAGGSGQAAFGNDNKKQRHDEIHF